jgi:hypothetical protein
LQDKIITVFKSLGLVKRISIKTQVYVSKNGITFEERTRKCGVVEES